MSSALFVLAQRVSSTIRAARDGTHSRTRAARNSACPTDRKHLLNLECSPLDLSGWRSGELGAEPLAPSLQGAAARIPAAAAPVPLQVKALPALDNVYSSTSHPARHAAGDATGNTHRRRSGGVGCRTQPAGPGTREGSKATARLRVQLDARASEEPVQDPYGLRTPRRGWSPVAASAAHPTSASEAPSHLFTRASPRGAEGGGADVEQSTFNPANPASHNRNQTITETR